MSVEQKAILRRARSVKTQLPISSIQIRSVSFGLLALSTLISLACPASGRTIKMPEANPIVFPLAQPAPQASGAGGVFAHDINADTALDLIVVGDNHIGAYEWSGHPIWVKKVNISLFDYLHHPSAIAGDMDGDGAQEVAYLTSAGEVAILDGITGEVERSVPVQGKPVAMAIANLRGKGDRDVILQYSQTRLMAIRLDDGKILWETDDYRGIEHSPLRQADLDGDDLDEVAGASIIDHDGTVMNHWDLGGAYRAMDSIVIADIVPGLPLEVALAEQRGAHSHTDVVNHERVVFRTLNPWNWEDPDKLAIGNFDNQRPGLEVFNRSSGGDGTAPRGSKEPYADEEAPWVLDSEGKLICKYYINDTKPSWWTSHGLEEICGIDWEGEDEDDIVGKERHRNGAGAIVDPKTGEFKKVFRAKATRIYSADVLADYREEVIILDEDGHVKVFWNDRANQEHQKPRYWTRQHYRRQKQNWNYYSP